MPQYADGIRMEPPPSAPSAVGISPAETVSGRFWSQHYSIGKGVRTMLIHQKNHLCSSWDYVGLEAYVLLGYCSLYPGLPRAC